METLSFVYIVVLASFMYTRTIRVLRRAAMKKESDGGRRKDDSADLGHTLQSRVTCRDVLTLLCMCVATGS